MVFQLDSKGAKAYLVQFLFATPPSRVALLRSDGFFYGAVCLVRRTLARSLLLGFQIGVPRCKKRTLARSAFHGSSLDSKGAKVCRSHQELSNEYFLLQFGVVTAENGPLKVCQQLARS